MQMASLEAAANEAVQLESRAEAAENERDEAVEELRCCTPRPQLSWDSLAALVGEQGASAGARYWQLLPLLSILFQASNACLASDIGACRCLDACCRRAVLSGSTGCSQAVAGG